MTERSDVKFFGAGPSGLADDIVNNAAQALINYDKSGLGLAEISHRSPTATQILDDTKTALKTLLDIPPNYEVLFMHGGGSGQFSAVVYNLLPVWIEKRRQRAIEAIGSGEENEAAVIAAVKKDISQYLKLDYLVTGSWSLKASQEAASILGPLGGGKLVNVALDCRKEDSHGKKKFGDIPSIDQWQLTRTETNGDCAAAFVYYCDNETVDGVEFPAFPSILKNKNSIVVADMSSNILSRRVDVSQYGVIFAGAQKNIGITDTTIVIVRKDLLVGAPTAFLHAVGVWSPPAIFNWSAIWKNNSLYNTMPIFSIFVAKMVLESLLSTHKDRRLLGQEELADEKARLFYGVVDAHPSVYQPVASISARSRMNICFRLADDAMEKRFLAEAKARNFLGLNGHRSVGGVRISNYNVVSLSKAELLVHFMEEFAASG